MKLSLLVIGLTLVSCSVSLDDNYDDLKKMSPTYLNDIDEDDLDRYRRGTLERRNAPTSTNTRECLNVQPLTQKIRDDLKLNDARFQVYLRVYGIVITAFGEANEMAMQRACYVLKFMLADSRDMRDAMFTHQVRFVLLADGQSIEDIPGMVLNRDYQSGGVYYGKQKYPVVTFTKEHVLCSHAGTTKEFIHVVAHTMLKYAIPEVFPYFKRRVRVAYNNAKSRRQLRGRYSAYDYKEYFAEGVLAFFNQVSVGRLGPRMLDTSRNTRSVLNSSDRDLYSLVNQIFPCAGINYVGRCESDIYTITRQIQMDCSVVLIDPPCNDMLVDCPFLADMGVCEDTGEVSIAAKCPYSCGRCTEPSVPQEDVIPEEEVPVAVEEEEDANCTDAGYSAIACQLAADRGMCRDRNMFNFTSVDCRKSCGFCDGDAEMEDEPVEEEVCQDDLYSTPVCQRLVRTNKCHTEGIRDFTRLTCRKSCGFCRAREPVGVYACTDSKYRDGCREIAEMSMCEDERMTNFTSVNCRKSCGFCRVEEEEPVVEEEIIVQEEVCADGEFVGVGCEHILNANNCDNNEYRAFVTQNCRKSCGLCGIDDDEEPVDEEEIIVQEEVCADGEFVGDGCKHILSSNNCDNNEYRDFVTQNCRKSCGLCGIDDDEEPVDEEEIIVQEEVCADGEFVGDGCKHILSSNNCDNNEYRDFVTQNCRKSCGLCGVDDDEEPVDEEEIIVEEEVCADNESATDGCNQIVSENRCNSIGFHNFAVQHCRKSCGLCGTESSVAPRPTAIAYRIRESCTDAYHNCQNRRQSQCATSKDMRRNCRKFCNLC